MNVESLTIDNKKFTFGPGFNMISSKKNSAGKTTLIRLLLYTMGYQIPSTKGMNFSNLELKLTLSVDNNRFDLQRNDNIVVVSSKSFDSDIILDAKSDLLEIQSMVYSISDPKILENILALHYFDQEKGWTLLNRGKVIGSVGFSVESFIEGLSSSELSELNTKLASLQKEQRAYKQIKAIIVSREDAENHSDDTDWTSIDQIQDEIRSTEMEIRKNQNDMARLQQIRTNNSKLIALIEGMNVSIRTKDGTKERVTKGNIVDFETNQSLITAQLARQKRILQGLTEQKARLSKSLDSYMSLVSVDTQLARFDAAISGLSISSNQLNEILQQYKDKIKDTRQRINTILSRTDITERLYKRILEYAEILGVDDMIDRNSDFIFTSNLKRYSGAKLHLLVFAYRLALLTEVQNRYKQLYPIILDSPLSGELDSTNFDKMLDLLDSKFSSNQIIVASIFDQRTDKRWTNRIILNDQLLDE